MAKSDPRIKELQRRLVRLSRLDGRLLCCADGAWLVWPDYVREPRALVAAISQEAPLTEPLLRRGFQFQQAPRLLEARWLAVAQRDLRALQNDPAVLEPTQAAARLFRGLPSPTPEWLAGRQQRVTELAAALSSGFAKSPPPMPPPGMLPAQDKAPRWLQAVVELVQTLHGESAAAALRSLWRRSLAAGPGLTARRRLAGLQARLSGQPDTRHEEPMLRDFLDQAAAQARSLLSSTTTVEPRRPIGRAQLRRLWRLVHSVIFWPASAERAHPPLLDGVALRAHRDGRRLLEDLAAPLLESLPQGRDPRYQERLARAVAHYGLLFRIEPDCPAVAAADLDWLEQQLDRAAAHLGPCPLRWTQALALLRAADAEPDLAKLAQHLKNGVPVELLTQACQLGYSAELREISGDTAAVRAYCEWVIRLAPLYKRSGQKLALSPNVTARFSALREPNLALLLHHLATAAATAIPRPGEVELQLSVLDSAVGLCGRVPQRAAALVGLLTTWPEGVGRARCPEFTAWLGDEALVDRYFHLAMLAGEPSELSRTLRRDFACAERRLGERSYLASLAAPTAEQLQRLHAVNAFLESAALPSPAWTHRRLQERVSELLGRALQRQMDIALRDVLHKSLGVAPPELTPAWRDAIRFYLLTERNAELLGTLLRFAAAHPGRSPARTLPANQLWLSRAGAHLAIDAWLAPRRRELELEGQRYVLAIEEDPIEVLRMGIPFGTCLSLTDGSNAAAAVCNAADANKRVLYLRDRRGVIVGRKLLAISGAFELLGYELYLALPPGLRPQIAAAVTALCQELAQAARIPLSAAGVPERLHDGFWYDDGPQPFTLEQSAPTDVSAYCRHLGQPPPRSAPPELVAEAAQWLAQQRGDAVPAIGLLRGGMLSLQDEEYGAWIIDRIGLSRAEQLARQSPHLRPFVLRRLACDSGPALLRTAGEWEDCDAYDLRQKLYAVPPSHAVAAALIAAAERCVRRRAPTDSHDLWHLTFSDLEASLALTAIGPFFALCDRLQVLWDRIMAAEPGCEICREGAEEAVLRAAQLAYCQKPDPLAVISALRSRRNAALTQRTALHLAAAFTLSDRAEPAAAESESLLWALIRPPRPGSHKGLHAVQVLGERMPQLTTEPDFLAALLRQAPRPLKVHLPRPDAVPFEALRELLFDPLVREQIAPLVLHLTKGPEDLSSYYLGQWELYYHRRHDTLLRQRLARIIVELKDDAALPSAVVSLLAQLGDVRTLSALGERWTQGARGRHMREAVEEAAAVSRQLELDAHPLGAPLSTPWLPSHDAHRRPPQIPPHIDRALLRWLLHTVASARDDRPGDDPVYKWALRALASAPLSRFATVEIVHTLWQARGGLLDAAELEFVSSFLVTKTTWELPEVSPELAVELWQLPAIRPVLAATLAKGSQWPLRYHRMRQHAASKALGLDDLLAQWLVAAIDRDVDTTVSDIGSRADLELLLDVAFTHLQPSKWLLIYKAFCGFAEAACFLARLRRSPPDRLALTSLQLLSAEAKFHRPDEQVRGEWLRGTVAELLAANS